MIAKGLCWHGSLWPVVWQVPGRSRHSSVLVLTGDARLSTVPVQSAFLASFGRFQPHPATLNSSPMPNAWAVSPPGLCTDSPRREQCSPARWARDSPGNLAEKQILTQSVRVGLRLCMFYWPCCWSAGHTLNSEGLECLLPILVKQLLVLQSLAQVTPLLEARTAAGFAKPLLLSWMYP